MHPEGLGHLALNWFVSSALLDPAHRRTKMFVLLRVSTLYSKSGDYPTLLDTRRFAEERSRTSTPLLAPAPKADVSAISPPRRT